MAAPEIHVHAVPHALEPTCRDCPRGAALSLTVYFLGLGEVGFPPRAPTYDEEELDFPRSLARRLGRDPHERCRKELRSVRYDHAARISENAAVVAQWIDRRIDDAVRSQPWLVKVNLHLVGFSSGGLLALDTARLVTSGRRLRDAGIVWCGREQDREVEVEIDLVTMATPFDLGLVLAGTPTTGHPWTFVSSVGASEYQAPPPGRLCSFTALVSSRRHGDESLGADRDPSQDDRLRAFLEGFDPTRRRIVHLRDEWRPQDPDDEDDPERVPHTAVPRRTLEDFPWALVPGCRCVETF